MMKKLLNLILFISLAIPAMAQRNTDQVLVRAWETANLAGFPSALAVAFTSSPAPPTNPSDADQVMTNVFNRSSQALQIYCISGCPATMSIGSAVGGGTAGSVLFVDGSGNLGQNNANFFWDDTNHRLGIGTNTPDHSITIVTNNNHVVSITSTGVGSDSMVHLVNVGVQGPFFDFHSSVDRWAFGISSSGNFNLRESAVGTDPVNGTNIFSFDPTGSLDIAGGFNTCIAASASGTAYTCNTIGGLTTAPIVGSRLTFIPDVDSGASPTIAPNGNIAAGIFHAGGQTAIAAGELKANKPTILTFDAAGHWDLGDIFPVTLSASSLTDGFVTYAGAQINRPGAAVEMQYGATSGSDFRLFGGGSVPLNFSALTGLVTTYGGKATAGDGITAIRAEVALTAQTVTTSGTLLTAPTADMYHVSSYSNTTTAGTGVCTMVLAFGYTDSTGAKTRTLTALDVGSTGATALQQFDNVFWVASGNLTYTATVAGAGCTNQVWDLHMTAAQL